MLHTGAPPTTVDYHRAGVRQQRSQGLHPSLALCSGESCSFALASRVGMSVAGHRDHIGGAESAVPCMGAHEEV